MNKKKKKILKILYTDIHIVTTSICTYLYVLHCTFIYNISVFFVQFSSIRFCLLLMLWLLPKNSDKRDNNALNATFFYCFFFYIFRNRFDSAIHHRRPLLTIKILDRASTSTHDSIRLKIQLILISIQSKVQNLKVSFYI